MLVNMVMMMQKTPNEDKKSASNSYPNTGHGNIKKGSTQPVPQYNDK